MDWEEIDEHRPSSKLASSLVERAPIFGGWLVRYTQLDYSGNLHAVGGITFVPDPKHEWDGSSGLYQEPMTPDEIAEAIRG